MRAVMGSLLMGGTELKRGGAGAVGALLPGELLGCAVQVAAALAAACMALAVAAAKGVAGATRGEEAVGGDGGAVDVVAVAVVAGAGAATNGGGVCIVAGAVDASTGEESGGVPEIESFPKGRELCSNFSVVLTAADLMLDTKHVKKKRARNVSDIRGS